MVANQTYVSSIIEKVIRHFIYLLKLFFIKGGAIAAGRERHTANTDTQAVHDIRVERDSTISTTVINIKISEERFNSN
jgi:hypothetical protein